MVVVVVVRKGAQYMNEWGERKEKERRRMEDAFRFNYATNWIKQFERDTNNPQGIM